jgi:hypothetical protein
MARLLAYTMPTSQSVSAPMQRDRAAPRIEAPATRPEGGKLQEAPPGEKAPRAQKNSASNRGF